MDFTTNKQMHNYALRLFHIEIKQEKKDHLIFVTDGNGSPVRHPIQMSNFQERLRYYLAKVAKIDMIFNHSDDKLPISDLNSISSKMLIDLFRLLPNYSYRELYKKKRQLINSKKRGKEEVRQSDKN